MPLELKVPMFLLHLKGRDGNFSLILTPLLGIMAVFMLTLRQKEVIKHSSNVRVKSTDRWKRMVEKSLILTGRGAELLSHALAEEKTKACGGPRRVWMTQALDALVSCFRKTEERGQEKERRHTYFSLLGKRLVLGTIIGRQGGQSQELIVVGGLFAYLCRAVLAVKAGQKPPCFILSRCWW